MTEPIPPAPNWNASQTGNAGYWFWNEEATASNTAGQIFPRPCWQWQDDLRKVVDLPTIADSETKTKTTTYDFTVIELFITGIALTVAGIVIGMILIVATKG